MIEPTTTGVIAWITGLSAITLALFGVDYHALLFALAGAMFALLQSEQMTWGRAVVYTLLSTLTGALLGSLAAVYVTEKPPKLMVMALCLFGGLMAQALAAAILKAGPKLTAIPIKWAEKQLTRIFGEKAP